MKLNIVSIIFSIIVIFLPIWKIKIKAPQFPQSLGIYITLNKIKEEKKNDIYSIDILNHYIGIRKIKEEKFKELKIINFFFLIIIVLKLIEISKKRNIFLINILELLLYKLTIILALFCIFKYNNLFFKQIDKSAPYSSLMEDLNYKPPVIGKKTIGKIEINSYPEIPFFLIASNFIIVIFKIIKKKNDK